MIAAILDTNVLVQSVIGSPGGNSSRVVDRLDDQDFQLVLSASLMDELLDVMSLPSMRVRHGWSDDEILDFISSLLLRAVLYQGSRTISPSITRDVTDAKFLGLAEESSADYPVTNDRRHLLRLGEHGNTRIVTPAEFLRVLDSK